MKIFAVIGATSAIGAFILGFLPIHVAVLVYALIGATVGSLVIGVKGWAQIAIGSLVWGLVAAILINEVLPAQLATASADANPLTAMMFSWAPFLLKAAVIGSSVTVLLAKVQGHPQIKM